MAADDPRLRKLMEGLREVLIIALGHVEDFLGVERSIVPRRKRESVGLPQT